MSSYTPQYSAATKRSKRTSILSASARSESSADSGYKSGGTSQLYRDTYATHYFTHGGYLDPSRPRSFRSQASHTQPLPRPPVDVSSYQPSPGPPPAPTPAISLHSNDSGYQSSYQSPRRRDLYTNEEDVAWEFLEHGKHCDQCQKFQNQRRTYRSYDQLCSHGNFLASEVNNLLCLRDGVVVSTIDNCPVNLGSQFRYLEVLLWAIERRSNNKSPPSAPFHNARRQSTIMPSRGVHFPPTPDSPGSEYRDQQSATFRLPTAHRGSYNTDGREPVIIYNVGKNDRRRSTVYRVHAPSYPSYRKSAPPVIDSEKVVRFEEPPRSVVRRTQAPPEPYPAKHMPHINNPSHRQPKCEDYSCSEDEYSSSTDSDTDPIVSLSEDDGSLPQVPQTKPWVPPTKSKELMEAVKTRDIENKSKKTNSRKAKNSNSKAEPLDLSLIPVQSTELSSPPSAVEAKSRQNTPLDNNEEGSGKIESTSSNESLSSPSNNQTQESEHVLEILNSALLQLKNTLLQSFIDHTTSEELTDGVDGPQKRARESSSPNSSQASDQPPHKRVRGKGRDPGDGGDGSGDDDDDSDHPPKRNGSCRRLKCPFYQRAPEKYSRAACRGEGFADMAKLKDHIKRVHTQPLRCVRCWKDMVSEDAYAEHLQAETSCTKQCQPVDDRITQKDLRRLDFKKAPYAHAKDTEEKWKLMYKELFPKDSETPSPYDQHGFTPRLEKVLYEALEEELTRELAPALEPILQRIKDRIPFIIQSCRQKLRASPESTDTPQSTITASSGDVGGSSASRSADFYRRQAEEMGSDSQPRAPKTAVRRTHLSKKAQGKRPQQSSSSPSAGSTTDDFQDSRHTSSPESVFDNRATPPTPNLTVDPSDVFIANESSGLSESNRLDRSVTTLPVPGSFPEPQRAPRCMATEAFHYGSLMKAPDITENPVMSDTCYLPALSNSHVTDASMQDGDGDGLPFFSVNCFNEDFDFNFDGYFEDT